MGLDFSTLVYLPNYDTFARPITVTPLASQPGAPAYANRGIYDTRPVDVQAHGRLDRLRSADHPRRARRRVLVVPDQLDRIYIGPDAEAGATGDEIGEYEVVDTESNGGGETTLVIRKIVTAKTFMTATDTTVFSYGLVIRDMLLTKLMTAPFFAGFTFRKSRQLPTQINQLPSLGVYLVKEDMTPDGDPNHGDIDMIHSLTIGFSVVIINNDPEATQEKLDQAYWTIMNWLWRDPYLMNMIDTRAYPGGVGNPDNVRIEALMNGSWRFFDHPPLNNETPMSELRYEQVAALSRRLHADHHRRFPVDGCRGRAAGRGQHDAASGRGAAHLHRIHVRTGNHERKRRWSRPR